MTREAEGVEWRAWSVEREARDSSPRAGRRAERVEVFVIRRFADSQSVIRHLLFAICRLALRTPLRIPQLSNVFGTDGVDGHPVEQAELPLH